MAVRAGTGYQPALAMGAYPGPTLLPPRVTVTVSFPNRPNTLVTITRADAPTGENPCRGAVGLKLNAQGVATIHDFWAPFGVPLTYTLISLVAGGPVVVLPPVQLNVTTSWLQHQSIPGLSMPVEVASLDGMSQPITQAVLSVLSRPRPVSVNDGARKSLQGTLTVNLRSQDELQAWVQLTKDGTPLLFTTPPGWGFEISRGWMSFAAISWTNPSGRGPDPNRSVSVAFTLVDEPPA